MLYCEASSGRTEGAYVHPYTHLVEVKQGGLQTSSVHLQPTHTYIHTFTVVPSPHRSGQQILLGDRVIVKGERPGRYCTLHISCG